MLNRLGISVVSRIFSIFANRGPDISTGGSIVKSLELVTKIAVCRYDELSPREKSVVDAARKATDGAYAPYSDFRVGCAVQLSDGTLVTGNNQEKAAYPSGLCAERTALFAAHAAYPDLAVRMLAVAARKGARFVERPIAPCGACRQVLCESEHRAGAPIVLLLCGSEEIFRVASVAELLPIGFDGF